MSSSEQVYTLMYHMNYCWKFMAVFSAVSFTFKVYIITFTIIFPGPFNFMLHLGLLIIQNFCTTISLECLFEPPVFRFCYLQ